MLSTGKIIAFHIEKIEMKNEVIKVSLTLLSMTSLSLFRSSSAVSQFCMRISEPNLPQRAFNVFLSSLPVACSKKYEHLLIFSIKFCFEIMVRS